MSKPFGGGNKTAPEAPGDVGGSSILGKLLGGGQHSAGKKEKLPAYINTELLERLRNTVVGLQRDPHVDQPPVSLSAFVEAAVELAIEEAEEEHNGGRQYPRRPNRHLKTGPPISS